MPQVASAPVISPPVRSDAPVRTPGQDEPSGAFGEMLDVSSAAPDAGGQSASGKSKEAPAPAAQSDQPAEPLQTANTSLPPVVAIELALLARELPVEGSPAAPVAATETDHRNATAGGDADAENTDAKATGDAASMLIDPKAPEVALTVILAPPPAPASAPVQTGVDAGAIVSGEPTPSIAVPSKSAPAGAPVQGAAANLPPPTADLDTASLPDLAKPADTPAETVAANGTTTLDKPAQGEAAVLSAQRPVAEAVNGKAEDKSAKPSEVAAAAPAPTEARPTPRPAAETRDDKAEAHPTAAPNAGKPAQAHPSADTPRPPDQPVDLDTTLPAHQPHGQPSEHASATARTASAAAHNDLLAPTSIAQTVTAQLASNPPALGLNLAAPLASPVQTLWQPTAQRADSTDNTIPISGLAVEIVSRVHEGLRRFEIRLDPPELGRIDVRLDVDRGGNVTSRLTVERAETLDLLRRDAPQLERALQHAGLNTEGGLQFSLRDQNFANREQTQQHSPTLIVPDDEPAAAEAARRGYGRLIGLGGGIDIRV
ncbi:MAG: flagellar hook-length control protein FliK [Xanthobacteraceae bacterium]